MIRTFLAVFPPREVQESIHSALAESRACLDGLRWVAPENLHFTLRFFGDMDAAGRDLACRAAEEVAASAKCFSLRLGEVGVFPRWSRPRVLWWGVDRGRVRLEALARLLNAGFQDLGLGGADKPFRAHLTLGRWKAPTALEAGTRERLFGALPRVEFTASALRLMGSDLGPGGARYRVLHESRLKSND